MSALSPILVTGSSGFIGSYLMKYLINLKGIYAVGADRNAGNSTTAGQSINLLNKDDVNHLLGEVKPACIFHLAGAVGIKDKNLLDQAHVQTTRVLLEGVRREVPAARIVVLGSAAEYGCAPGENKIISEHDATQPHSAYGRSKLEQKNVAVQLARKWDLDLIHVRLFNTIGPGQGPHLVAGAMVHRLFEAIQGHAEAFKVYDPYSQRDFLDVRDVGRLLWHVAGKAVAGSPQTSIHICSGKGSSILDLAHDLYQAAGVSESDLPLDLISEREPTRCLGSTKILRQILGDEPLQTISLSEMLQDMWQWQASQQKTKTAIVL